MASSERSVALAPDDFSGVPLPVFVELPHPAKRAATAMMSATFLTANTLARTGAAIARCVARPVLSRHQQGGLAG